MAGSTFGTIFRITTWGESHGRGIGVVIDGCPAGIALTPEDIQIYLNRRKPGQSKFTTARQEGDQVEILSGIFDGKTTGTPISMMVLNQDQHSRDYSEIASYYRPGHADFTFDEKYGFRDYRGGGRSSGRETIGRVAAGAVAMKLLGELGISVRAYSREIAGIAVNPAHFDWEELNRNKLYMPDANAAAMAEERLGACMAEGNSAGGIIECVVSNLPAGIGEPVFDKLDASLSKALFSIGAVKGVEIGDGFAAAKSTGADNNDAFIHNMGETVTKETNHAGGILGGISDGSDILIRAAVKPTPSISKPQHTISQSGENIEISIKGRHDPIIVPRAVVVVESMTALTLADLLLLNMSANMEHVKRVYRKNK